MEDLYKSAYWLQHMTYGYMSLVRNPIDPKSHWSEIPLVRKWNKRAKYILMEN